MHGINMNLLHKDVYALLKCDEVRFDVNFFPVKLLSLLNIHAVQFYSSVVIFIFSLTHRHSFDQTNIEMG